MGYDSALQRKEMKIYATKWMNLEEIVLSDINQSHVLVYLHDLSGVVKHGVVKKLNIDLTDV